jgi:hypothetical protein
MNHNINDITIRTLNNSTRELQRMNNNLCAIIKGLKRFSF